MDYEIAMDMFFEESFRRREGCGKELAECAKNTEQQVRDDDQDEYGPELAGDN